MIFFHKNQVGFSLVETLVAVSILLIVITGPMSISMRTAKSASFASEQVQAFFLAQEGLELVEMARDEYLLRGFLNIANPNYLANPWAVFSNPTGTFVNCFNPSNGCGLEMTNANGDLATPKLCAVAGDCLLKYNSSGVRSKYSYTASGTTIDTLFTRTIFFSTSGVDGIKVRSVVTWRTGSLVEKQTTEVETYLYNVYN